jgi:hypothetical protein
MRLFFSILVVLMCTFVARLACAHPASGIVVDANGQVFFLDTGEPSGFRGVIWKIDSQGSLTAVHDSGAHFLALDLDSVFGGADLGGWFRSKRTQWLQRVAVPGSTSSLIQADGSPIAMGTDGGLYYASAEQLERAGVVQIARLAADGTLRTPTPTLPAIAKKLGGIRGLAFGQDGDLYVAYESAVQKIMPTGVTTLVDSAAVKDCDVDVPADGRLPFLRGLAVDSRGVVYAAATGCRRVIRITGDRVETALKAERPWSPTGVATFRDDVYVLEYTNPHGNAKEWRPRVRKIKRDGTVATLVTISPEDRARVGAAR